MILPCLVLFCQICDNLHSENYYLAGENDAYGGATEMNGYNCTFPAMISDWRDKFGQSGGTADNFPFGFVQVRSSFIGYKF